MSFKRIIFALVALVVVAMPTFAAPLVSFTTTGVFTCISCAGSGTGSITFGSGSLVFIPGGGTVDLDTINPTNGNFGQIDASGFTSAQALNGTLTLTINQTVPTADSGSLLATLTGNIAGSASNGRLLFTTSSIMLGGNVTYTISQPANGLLIVPPSTNSGLTTIEGTIGMPTHVPEPGTWALTGIALMSVGLIRRRRRS